MKISNYRKNKKIVKPNRAKPDRYPMSLHWKLHRILVEITISDKYLQESGTKLNKLDG